MTTEGAAESTAAESPEDAPKRRRTSLPRRVLRTLLLCYVSLGAVLYLFEHRLVFLAERYPAGDWRLPGDVEEVEFNSLDDVRLVGWYFPHENPQNVVLFHHGNGGNVTINAPMAEALRKELQATVFIYDYRGYGKSEDVRPHEEGVLKDARAARAWLAERAGVAESDVVLVGESLGGGVAVDLAAKDGAPALITLWTFSSLHDVAQWRFPIIPVRWLMRNRLDSVSKIGDYHGPFLHIHGDSDDIVPYRFGARLFQAANSPKRFVTVEDGEHNEMPPREFFAEAAAMLEAVRDGRTPWVDESSDTTISIAAER